MGFNYRTSIARSACSRKRSIASCNKSNRPVNEYVLISLSRIFSSCIRKNSDERPTAICSNLRKQKTN